MTTTLSPKDPVEVIPITFDFANALGADSILSVTSVITVINGNDPAPNDIKLSPPVYGENVVTQWLTGGISGVSYGVKCIVVTLAGKTLALAAVIAVNDAINL